MSLKAVAIPVSGECKADCCLHCIFRLVMPTVCEYVYINKCVCVCEETSPWKMSINM